jgi:SAM-dependent methyltransferase
MAGEIEALASPGVHEKVFEIVCKLHGNKVFDAPAGHGAMTEKLLSLGKVVTAGDIDIDQFKLDRCQKNLTLLRLDLTDPHLTVRDNEFDIAICVEGVEHLENQWILARNLCRILKPGGFLILSTPNIINFRSRFRFFWEARYEFFKRPLVQGKSISHDLHVYHIAPISYFELQFILERSGFSIKELHANIYSSKNIISMLMRPFFRLSYAYKNYRDNKRQRGEHRELYRTIMSDELYYGETLILVAQKKAMDAA